MFINNIDQKCNIRLPFAIRVPTIVGNSKETNRRQEIGYARFVHQGTPTAKQILDKMAYNVAMLPGSNADKRSI